MYGIGAFLRGPLEKIIKTMEYQKTFAETAKEVLSRPFKSKQHVCQAIGISVNLFDKWVAENEVFERAVSEGFLNGEVKTRNFLAKVALLPNKKVDIKVFMELAKDIYGIGINDEMADNVEPVKWKFEIVRSDS